jgi:hypothetical protein
MNPNNSIPSSTEALPESKHFADTYTPESGMHVDEDRIIAGVNTTELLEEGQEILDSTVSFVKSNWMAILGAGVVVGLGAYVLKNGLPFGLAAKKKTPTQGKAKGIAKKVTKIASSRAH